VRRSRECGNDRCWAPWKGEWSHRSPACSRSILQCYIITVLQCSSITILQNFSRSILQFNDV